MTQARRRNQSARQAISAQVHTRRAYTDGRHGQLHLTTAYPSGGGFDERTPLICLHPAAASGSWFRSLLPELGIDRSVYAPDLPAHGQSDPTAGPELDLSDYVAAIGDFLDSMRLRTADLLGHQLGATVAAELAAQRPQQIRRVVLVAIPETAAEPARKPAPAMVQSTPRAVKPGTRLAAVTQQTLLLYPADAAAAKREPALPQHTVTSLAQSGDAIYSSGAQELAQVVRSFLDR